MGAIENFRIADFLSLHIIAKNAVANVIMLTTRNDSAVVSSLSSKKVVKSGPSVAPKILPKYT
jgi:hypothetical protein